MATIEDRIRDPEYHNWVKSALCLQYTKDGLINFCGIKSLELNQKIIQALRNRGNPSVYNLCPNIAFDFNRKSISCCNNCNDILLEMMKYRPWYRSHNPGKIDLKLGNSDPKQLVHQHWQCSKLYMNEGQDVNSTTPVDSDISGLINFIDHCTVPKGCIINAGILKQVRKTRNRVLHTPDMKITNNDFQNDITPLLIDLLQDPGFLSTDPDAKTAVDMIKDVKKADFIITKDDEEKALYALKDEIHQMNKLNRDEMRKLDDRVETLSKDVSSLKQDELRVLQDGLTKNDTDISEVKQMYETLREKVEQSNDIHLQLKELQDETKSMVDIQRELITMQEEIHDLHKVVEEMRNKDGSLIPSEQDKAGLRKYLLEVYKDKLHIALLPDWEPLHVSEIFTPSILVAVEGNEEQRGEKFKSLGKEEPLGEKFKSLGKEEQRDKKFKSLGSYKEIFYNKDDLQKRVILLGEAGCGKSTFCKHLTEIWRGSTSASQFTDTDVLEPFNYLFFVSCRFAKKEETLLNMIAYQLFGDDDNKMTVARYVLKHHPDLCLIIVDGADEWEGSPSSDTGRRGDIVGLPGLEGVTDCVVLVTSRPWKFHSMSTQTQKGFRRLKIDGIQNVNVLSQQILQKLNDPTPEKSAVEFLQQVRDRNMSELMKIPLILVIVLRGWVGDNNDEMVRSLHKSMYINYIHMIQVLIRRSKGQAEWSNSESKLRHLVPNFEILEMKWRQMPNILHPVFLQYKDMQRNAGLLLSVGQLAFALLLGTEEQSLVFSKTKVKIYLPADDENDESINACLALGILSRTETTTRGLNKLESYAFCHKTFQEFFAALWLASMYKTEKTRLYQCIKTTKILLKFEILIRFLCGFDPAIGKKVWMFVTQEVELGEEMNERQTWLQWEEVQTLACTCMKEYETDPKNQKSGQIYVCIPHIRIDEYTSEEDIMLLCHVMEEYYNSVKSVGVYSYMPQQHAQNISKSVSSCSGLQNLNFYDLPALSFPVLDLQKHTKLEKLELTHTSIEGLLLPIEGATVTSLKLYDVTMTHHGMEQLVDSLSKCISLLSIDLWILRCRQHTDGVCIPLLDLQKYNKLENLKLIDIFTKGLLLPVKGATITSLKLFNVTMTHYGMEQLMKTLSSSSSLVDVDLRRVRCNEHVDNVCIPVLDLRKHIKLKNLELMDISLEGLLLPVVGANDTSQVLDSVTMIHHGLEQLVGFISSCCNSCQKQNRQEELELSYISVEGLLLPVDGATITILDLDIVTMPHRGLIQLMKVFSSCSCLVDVGLSQVKCSEHDGIVCIPVLDLQKHKKLRKLQLRDVSLEGLLLPMEGATITLLDLDSVTVTHHGLKQFKDTMSSCSSLEEVNFTTLKCSEHRNSTCIPVLDLQSHSKLEKLKLKIVSVEGLLLPMEEATITSLGLYNLTLTHHGMKQLVDTLSSCSSLLDVGLSTVKCSEHGNGTCIPVLDLRRHNKLEELKLEDICVEGLLLSVKGSTITSLGLYNLTMTHHSLKQLEDTMLLCSSLVEVNLTTLKCSEHSNSTCITVLDLRKHNKLEELKLIEICAEGLLLPVEGFTITSLCLYNLTLTHNDMKQLVDTLSSCSSLVKVNLTTLECSEHGNSTCIPVLDLQSHNKLVELKLIDICVEGLLLPVEGASINVTMTHHGLEQLMKSLLSSSRPGVLNCRTVKCSEHTDSVCIPAMCLQSTELEINDIFVEYLPLPVDCTRTKSLKLCNVILSHNGLAQLGETSFSLLEDLHLKNIGCREHGIGACIPYLDLLKQKNLKRLILDNLSIESLLLPEEEATITSLCLHNLTITHHSLEQVVKFVTFCPGLEELDVRKVKCVEHNDTVCIPVLDIQKHNNLKQVILINIAVEGLLLPEGEASITSVLLHNLTITHHSLEQVVKCLSFCPGLEKLDVRKVKCVEHDDTVCIPVLDLQKQNNLKELTLDTASVESLLLPEGEATITSLTLYNLTITHHSLEQVVKFVSFYPGLEQLDVRKVKCVEHDDTVCIPVLDLQTHNNLKQVILDTVSIESLLLPEGEATITSLTLYKLTITHHSLEQVVKFVSFYPGLKQLDVRKVKCVEHDDTVCIPVLDLQTHNNLKQVILINIAVEGLLLPEGEASFTSVVLHNLTITHHSLEQVVKCLSFCPGLETLDVRKVKCVEHDDTVCIPVLDLQKQNNLKELTLDTVSVESLLLSQGESTITSLTLYNFTVTHHSLEQIVKCLSFCPGLEKLDVRKVKCVEHDDTVCIPVLDLQKQNNLKELTLDTVSIESLLLSQGESTITSLTLYNLTITHHSLEQVVKFVSFCPGLEVLDVRKVKCVEHDDTVCIPVLDLQKQNNLKELTLDTASVESLLLPEGEATITSLTLYNLTITHHSLEQVVKFVSFYPGLEQLDVRKVKCVEHDDTVCIPVLDLQKHNNLKQVILDTVSIESLLLPEGEATITSLTLYNLTITHHSLEQVVKFVSFYPGLEQLDVRKVKCVEHDDTVCIPVLDLQTHNNLKQVILINIAVEGLLLPEGEASFTSVVLHNLTITHHSLEQVVKCLSFCLGLETLDVRKVKSVEHDDTVCIPVLDLQKQNNLKQLTLDTVSVESLLLSQGDSTITSLTLYNLTVTHHSLEQVVKCLSFCPGLEKLDVRKIKCAEHHDTVCIPVLDLQKQNNLKQLTLDTVSVESLLLSQGESTITSLTLYNLTVTHHSLEQVVKCLSFCPGLETLDVRKVKCVEHDDTVCIPVLDLQKQNNLKELTLDTVSVESLLLSQGESTITSLTLYNFTVTHHSLEQIVKCLSFCPGLEKLDARKVKCVEHDDTVCIPVLDLQKQNNLKELTLDTVSIESLLLSQGESTITSLTLYNLTITHHSLEQVVKFVSFCPGLEVLDVRKVKCVEHDDTVCIPVLDLQKQNNLKQLTLDTVSVESLLLSQGESTITSLTLYNLTVTHHSLEQVVKCLSFCPGLETLDVRKVKCVEHDDTVCIPVLDLQKQNLKELTLDTVSVESLLLSQGESTITSLTLYNLTVTHHSLEQVVKCLSFCPGLEKLDVRKIKCAEHHDTVCIPVLDLQKQNNLKQLTLDTVSVESLLLSQGESTITSLTLYNLTVTHHSLEQVVKCLSFCPGLETLDVRKVKCVEHDDTVCIPVLDLQKQNNLKELTLDTVSITIPGRIHNHISDSIQFHSHPS